MNTDTRKVRQGVLDHGYIELVEHWGSDERIIESARMSTQKGFEGWGPMCKHCGISAIGVVRRSKGANAIPSFQCARDVEGHEFVKGDEKLLRYLYEHKHSTPFEMAGLVIEVKAPLFIFRQWHRHRTQSYNEMSARYSPIPNEHYIPSVERLMATGGKNKQASGEKGLTREKAAQWRGLLAEEYRAQNEVYELGLSSGVPKELARLAMPVGRYSCMRASANLRNWLGFLTLRTDSHAQWEIQEYARAVGALVAEHFPRTWELFTER